MIISSIVAVGPHREIGLHGKMSWNYPSEYRHFLTTVSGHFILMGRVNFDDNIANLALLKRVRTLVVSSNSDCLKFLPAHKDFDITCCTSIRDAIHVAESQGEQELFIIGGEKIYTETLSIVDRIYYSVVPYNGQADRFFPEIPLKQFSVKAQQSFASTTDSPRWDYILYEKIK